MNEKIEALKSSFDSELKKIANMVDLEALRVNYLGRKGKVTDALKGMGGLTDEQKKTVGRETNELKTAITVALAEKLEALKAQELQREINALPEFDISMPPDMTRGSYHPITLVQRQCEQVFKSMGFTVEDYAEVVFHPARDMQDTYYLDNGQLLKTQTSAAQNAIYRRYRDALVNDGVPIKAIFPGRCFRNEATDACHENTFFQMEGIMVDKDISIANLIYFMKTMLSEVFRKDIKVRLRPGFFPFVEPGFELDISCLICAFRLAGAVPLRHDSPRSIEGRRHRPGAVHRLRVRLGHDAPCHDEVRREGHSRPKQRQPDAPGAVHGRRVMRRKDEHADLNELDFRLR